VGVAGAAFHPLTVREVRRETADSVSVSFEVPDQRAEDFRFEPGQFLSLRREVDGNPVTRQYSICSGLADGELRIAVRRADGGAVSPWIVDTLRAGDTLEVAPPAGRFTTALNALARRRVLGVAAGSGITPVLSILKSVLDLEPHSRAVLLVGNKGPDSVMLADAIDELAASADGRLTVVHQFSRPVQAPEGLGETPVRHGRLDAERLAHPDFEPLRLGEVDDAFLCGPGGFVSGVKSHLIESGVPADRIRSESFDRGAAPDLSLGAATEGTPLTIVAGGAASDVVQGGTDTILEAGLRAGLDLPYSCMAGSCGTCIARVTAGDVDPGAGELTADERAAGQVLTCQARATAPGTCVSYDPADATAVLTAVPGGTAAGRP
ncbi:MAG: ferredoxin--NADP reductase, partial [Dermatophilaceae bacterium]|nr:ferredoxin--NADP reductase [Dermatophilaceae bacterium]